MPFPRITLSYPGINQYESCTIGTSHGIQPAGISLRIAPQNSPIGSSGDFTISDGHMTITFVDCEVVSSSLELSEHGYYLNLVLLDFRRKWKYSRFSLVANLRGEDGKIVARAGSSADDDSIENDEWTPQDIATNLLQALGVTDYDVTQMPNDARPYLEWNNARADLALAELCEHVGCIICPTPDGSVSIQPWGVGADMPQGYIKQISGAVQAPQKPKTLTVVCADTRYQADLFIEAVGIDIDGSLKLLNDLSYRPPGGWPTEPDFTAFGNIANVEVRELARKSVYKYYRIKCPCQLPGYGQVDFPEQLIVEGEQVDTVVEDGKLINQRALVYGNHFPQPYNAPMKNVYTLLGIPDPDDFDNAVPPPASVVDDVLKLARLICETPFTIAKFRENYVVIFEKQIFKIHDDSAPANFVPSGPTLFLRAAYHVRDKDTRQPIKYERSRDFGIDDDGTKQVSIHEEMNLNYARGLAQNKALVDKECDYYLDGMARKYVTVAPQEALYGWILPIDLDGAIQTITYTIDMNGNHTRIGRNLDVGTPVTEPYGVRALRAVQRRLIDLAYKETGFYDARQVGLASLIHPGL
jgi:hypothetical protein